MIQDLVLIQYLALVMGATLALLWIVHEFSRNPPRKSQEKSRMFACGMDVSPEDAALPSDSYYSYLKRLLGTRHLARLHSGKLSDYNIWIIIGTALIMAVMLILW
ncbi:MAG: hypothetical protein KAT35_00490 [Candidatus Aenigmarchaeota archaeon]|nr:hypothetical protein [Candidatus Aenigmarchaeota archaeon]